MSAAMTTARATPAAMIVVHDPDEPGPARWLVLQQAAVDGMPTWSVMARHDTRARAEHEAGLHFAAPVAWLLHDPALGWRLSVGHGWTAAAGPRNEFTQLAALALAAREPGLETFVRRANGRLTCPDPESGPSGVQQPSPTGRGEGEGSVA